MLDFRTGSPVRNRTAILILISFGLYACGGSQPASNESSVSDSKRSTFKATATGPTPLSKTSPSATPIATASKSSSSDSNDDHGISSIYWLLGTIGVMAAVVGIAALFGAFDKDSKDKESKSETPKTDDATVKANALAPAEDAPKSSAPAPQPRPEPLPVPPPLDASTSSVQTKTEISAPQPSAPAVQPSGLAVQPPESLIENISPLMSRSYKNQTSLCSWINVVPNVQEIQKVVEATPPKP